MDLSETQKMYKGLLDRESLRATDGVKYFRDTLWPHFIKGAQSVFFWMEILPINLSEKRTRRDGQVGWKMFIALETLEGFLDGHVADVLHERRTKSKSVSCRCEPRK